MISKNQIKYIQSLHSKKNREEEGVFIIEGIKLVSEFIGNDKFTIQEIFSTAAFLNVKKSEIEKHQIKHTEISTEELQKISLQTSPNQVLAIVNTTPQEVDIHQLNNAMCLFLDDIRDPGNLGTIIRIADWFGIKQVICSPNCAEVYNPKTIQASMGAILRVNVVSESFKNLTSHIPQLPIYGAVLEGENIYTTTLKKGLLVIGNEANGISEEVLSQINHRITIPAANSNGSESLNAANACAIICSEFYRQLSL